MMFRVGRKAKRTLYLQTGPDQADNGLLVGLIDDPKIAQFLVDAVNEKLDRDETGGADEWLANHFFEAKTST
jgi:hypothetical protein